MDSALIVKLANLYGTPLYILSWPEIFKRYNLAKTALANRPVRHWLSLKTLPIRAVLRAWTALGEGVEVVSEFEFNAALSEGVSADRILVNGVGKAQWLQRVTSNHLRVHFDSILECEALIPQAKTFGWRTGIRIKPRTQFDPDDPSFRGQFGMQLEEAAAAVQSLLKSGIAIESVHFHLKSEIETIEEYIGAIKDVYRLCQDTGVRPRFIDFGGGLPCAGENYQPGGVPKTTLGMREIGSAVDMVLKDIPSVEEVWLENGRYMLSEGGALVVRVLDVKEHNDARYLICDGGRINNAFVSDWQRHKISIIPHRNGPLVLTSVCGPTCMAYDWMDRGMHPNDIGLDDLLIWHNAGAYHIPWETRFSNGLAAVAWIDADYKSYLVRPRESFDSWWGQWNPMKP